MCAPILFLCALVSRLVCMRTRAQLKKNILLKKRYRNEQIQYNTKQKRRKSMPLMQQIRRRDLSLFPGTIFLSVSGWLPHQQLIGIRRFSLPLVTTTLSPSVHANCDCSLWNPVNRPIRMLISTFVIAWFGSNRLSLESQDPISTHCANRKQSCNRVDTNLTAGYYLLEGWKTVT